MGRALILLPDDLLGNAPSNIGGKATGLLALRRAGLPVPPWAVLPFEVVAARAWHRDSALRAAIVAVQANWGGRIAARSSAEGEDARDNAHAGQYHTAFADDAEGLLAALDAVADSARGAAMAIVLQRALMPDWAGVAFSAQPSAARTDQFYLEAVRGHARQLVEGAVSPLRYTLTLEGVLERMGTVGNSPGPIPAGAGPALAEALLRMEETLNTAVDIEWAMEGDTLYFVQARPLTALAADPAQLPTTCHTAWFFDQRFLEPISPFSRSTLIPLIVAASVGEALAMRGHTAEATVHYHGGQAYLPHEVYARMLRGAPRWFLSPDLRQLFPRRGPCAGAHRASLIDTLAYARDAMLAVLRHGRDVFGNVYAWNQFRAALPHAIGTALNEPDIEAQWAALDALSRRFLALHRWSILWADYAYRGYRALAWAFGAARTDAALRHGMQLPTVAANAALHEAQARNTPDAWAGLVAHYGHRSDSLDYATPTWAERYAPGIAAAADHLGAEATPSTRGGLLARALGPVRRLLEMREEQRFAWEHILAAQRALVLSEAKRQRAAGRLMHEDDVWLLSWDEFLALHHRATVPARAVIIARRHARYIERLVPRPTFLTPSSTPDAIAPGAPHGVGASAGVARGTAYHLRRPGATLPSDLPTPCIFVVPALDPAHTHLLRAAAGIIAERGGLLSHAAILAREYRVPLVTACDDVFARVPHGVHVEIDGQSGNIVLGSGLDPV